MSILLSDGRHAGGRFSRHEQKAALERLARKFGADLTLLDARGANIASVGPVLSAPRRPRSGSGIVHSAGHGMLAVLALRDGRTVLADESGGHRHRPLGALLMIAMFAGALALASFPLARRLTRRLGQGDGPRRRRDDDRSRARRRLSSGSGRSGDSSGRQQRKNQWKSQPRRTRRYRKFMLERGTRNRTRPVGFGTFRR